MFHQLEKDEPTQKKESSFHSFDTTNESQIKQLQKMIVENSTLKREEKEKALRLKSKQYFYKQKPPQVNEFQEQNEIKYIKNNQKNELQSAFEQIEIYNDKNLKTREKFQNSKNKEQLEIQGFFSYKKEKYKQVSDKNQKYSESGINMTEKLLFDLPQNNDVIQKIQEKVHQEQQIQNQKKQTTHCQKDDNENQNQKLQNIQKQNQIQTQNQNIGDKDEQPISQQQQQIQTQQVQQKSDEKKYSSAEKALGLDKTYVSEQSTFQISQVLQGNSFDHLIGINNCNQQNQQQKKQLQDVKNKGKINVKEDQIKDDKNQNSMNQMIHNHNHFNYLESNNQIYSSDQNLFQTKYLFNQNSTNNMNGNGNYQKDQSYLQQKSGFTNYFNSSPLVQKNDNSLENKENNSKLKAQLLRLH